MIDADTSRRRVLMIGIDSADLDYILSVRAELPGISALIDRGALRRLAVPGDLMSASVWPTFLTGAPPGEHGHYFPMQFDPDTMKFRRVSASWLPIEPWWYAMGRRGTPVTTFNVQVLMESRDPPGLEVANWGGQSFAEFRCNQPQVGREIIRRFGIHPMGPDVPVSKSQSRLEAMRDDLLTGVERRGEITRWLLARADWQLAIAVFTECHRAGHYFWPDAASDPGGRAGQRSPLLDVYRAADDQITRIIAAGADAGTTVVVFSLHGMGPNSVQDHFLRPVIDRFHARLGGTPDQLPATSSPRPNVARTLRARLPAGIQEAIALAVPERARDWVIARSFGAGVDWPRVPALVMPSGGEGYLRFNLIGRERRGCLTAGSDRHRHYAAQLRQELLALRVPATGRSLIKEIVPTSEALPGPRGHLLPDWTLIWNEGELATEVASPLLGSFHAHLATGRGGNHRASAFAIVAGAGVEQTARLERITDFGPFVTALLGQ